MTREIKITELELRLANTERVLVAFYAFMKDTISPQYMEQLDKMMNDYFDVNSDLGADFNNNNQIVSR